MGPYNLPINIEHYAGQLYSNRGKQPVSLDSSMFGVIEDGKWKIAPLPVSVFHGDGGDGLLRVAGVRRQRDGRDQGEEECWPP